MIYPHSCGRKQIVSFRTINRTQTTGGSTTSNELAQSGIHYSELIYDKEYPNPWGFDFCGTEQARETTFTFDGIVGVNGYVNIIPVTPLVRNGYTMTRISGNGGILDRGWNTSINSFTGGVCGGYSAGLVVSFTRDNGQSFAATSVAIGSLLTNYPTANWTVTGYFASGGSERTILQGFASTKTTVNFPSYFRNLTNLVFVGVSTERPAFDELVLVDAPHNPSLVRMDFNGTVGGPGDVGVIFAQNATYSQYGYTMERLGANALGLYDNDVFTLLNAFEDDVVLFFTAAGWVRVERDDGLPFNAKSLVMGGLQTNGSLVLTGNRVGGGTVTSTLYPQQGANTTVNLPDGFHNLQSLDIVGSCNAAFDDLILEDYVPPGT